MSDGNSSCDEEKQPQMELQAEPGKSLLDVHPQQTTHKFDNGITISSKFDSGNLSNVRWNPEEPNRFELYMSGDGLPYTKNGHYYSWFYFSVKNAKPNEDYVFSIRNMGF